MRRQFPRWPLWLFCLATPLWAQSLQPQGEVRITLQPRVFLPGGDVRLGDIASLSSHNLPVLRRLVELPLGRAPRVGESVVLDRTSLVSWVRSRTGIATNHIVWAGSRATELSVQVQEVSGDMITSAAEAALHAALENKFQGAARIELYALTGQGDLLVPAQALEVRVRPISAGTVAPLMTVWVDVMLSGRAIKTTAVAFEVAVHSPVAVASRDLLSGSVLESSDFVLTERDITRGGLTKNPSVPVAGQQVRRRMRAGDVVSRADTAPVPWVTRGSWAFLESRDGGVIIESRAEVLQDGHADQRVQVRQGASKAILLARVVGPGRLEISQ